MPWGQEEHEPRFRDRVEAGRALSVALARYRHDPRAVVLALPRGGVPVGFEVATALGLPLDVFVVRKLGVPRHPEVAMGAIASGGVLVLNQETIEAIGIAPAEIEAVRRIEARELARREAAYRPERPPLDVRGKTAIVVDDGLATGATLRAAVTALRQRGAARIVAAVPVGATDTCAALRAEVDELVCLHTPSPFHAVGLWYQRFEQTTDDEVRDLLSAAEAHPA